MAVNPLMEIGISGVQRGLNGMRTAAQDVAKLSLNNGNAKSMSPDGQSSGADSSAKNVSDATEAIIDLQSHKRQVQASTKVIETADQLLGFLLDVKA